MSRRTSAALLTALGCAALAGLTWVLAFRTGAGHAADAAALDGFARLQSTHASLLGQQIAHLFDPVPYALLAGVVVVVALITRGPRGAIAVAAILVIPNAVTQQLKVLTAEDRVPGSFTSTLHVDPVSWPSGHSTAAMAFVLCAVIASPAGARRVVALAGALFAAAVAYSVVLLGWHFPSDALGGVAVAGAGASLGIAALSAAEGERAPGRRPWAVPAAAALALAVLGALLARVAVELSGNGQRAAFLAGAGAIVAFGMMLAAGAAAGLSRPAATTAPPSRWRRATG